MNDFGNLHHTFLQNNFFSHIFAGTISPPRYKQAFLTKRVCLKTSIFYHKESVSKLPFFTTKVLC